MKVFKTTGTVHRYFFPVLCLGLLILFNSPVCAQTGERSGASANPTNGAAHESAENSRHSLDPPLPGREEMRESSGEYRTTLNDGEFLEQFSEEELRRRSMNRYPAKPMHRGVVDDDFIEQFSDCGKTDIERALPETIEPQTGIENNQP